jgi:tetratricopeptide (TPR) repeat protein
MNLHIFRPVLLSLLVTAVAPVVAQTIGTDLDASDRATQERLPQQELTPQVLYQFLLAEIAGQRGEFSLSASAYANLAKTTRDPRIAKRAAEIGLHTRQFEPALEAARLWSELDPDSAAARQMVANLLVALQRIDELGGSLSAELATAGPRIGEALLRLNRMLGRYSDKMAVRRLVEQATEPYLQLPEAHFARAQAAANARETLRALTEIERALVLRPDWEMAALFKAQQLEKGAALVSFLERFVTAYPAAREARVTYARALVGEKRYEDAFKEFNQVLVASPDSPDVIYAVGVLSLQLNDAINAERQLKRLVELNVGDLNPARFYLGQIAEEDKRNDEALRWYGEIDGGEHQMAARLRAAQVLAKQGKLDDARVRLQQARAGLPDEAARLSVAEAQLLREANRNEEALAVLETALAGQSDQPDLLYEIALVAERLDRLVLAEKYLRRLIEVKPESAQGYNALGYSLADRNLRLDEAGQLIDKALALSPDDPFILDSKGWVLFRQGKLEAAANILRSAYQQRPDAEIAAHLGEVLWVLGRRDEAATLWSDAVKANPASDVLSATIKRLRP